ncbi:ParA family protein [Pantoea sp. Bo_2]|uniref:ParA family protein n=1 Tax=Candidatus Pantoea gossypiicola TaxID=2608008 RepID=A0AB34CCN2_9GAMM|nr:MULTISPECIES: ParA family protein [Pantoea]KAA5937573.1 ParA family protein [Pantoea sp. VH_3]KAA5946704.1 ParA family protein [Pantoea sp. VH_25]KAA5949524.1 ParA family protein [Pantoea sp. VH_24]KAA5957729.1 ParA family protein [Pantoea sp. VH_16]KAA5959138.1 ParA family protein [Pantoea sp. VH_18]
MTLSIALIGGKGGVTKSTIARALGVAYAAADWRVLGADLELGQATIRKWAKRREEAGFLPSVPVQSFGAVSMAAKEVKNGSWDIVILDCPAFASKSSIEVAELADMVVLPTRFSIDDMESTAETANSLVVAGVQPEKIAIVFSGVAEARSSAERERDNEDARAYFSTTPYFVIDGYIPHQKALSTAQDVGRTITECQYKGPREKADRVIQGIISRFESITEDK